MDGPKPKEADEVNHQQTYPFPLVCLLSHYALISLSSRICIGVLLEFGFHEELCSPLDDQSQKLAQQLQNMVPAGFVLRT